LKRKKRLRWMRGVLLEGRAGTGGDEMDEWMSDGVVVQIEEELVVSGDTVSAKTPGESEKFGWL
jgi:hypothetical protein